MFHFECRRDAVAASGRDAATYLQSQLSQDLRPLADGDSAWSFVLSPNGKVESLLRVCRHSADRFVLDTDMGFGGSLIARMQRFRIRVDVSFESIECGVVVVRGSGLPVPPEGSLVGWGEGFDMPAGHPALAGLIASVPAGSADDLLRARIEARWPAMGAEIIPGETVPAETGIVPVAVSFTKGCYPGQELVERMDSRGSSAPWRLEAVDVDRGAAAGDPVVRDGVEIGTLTSVCGTRALARIRRSA